MKEELALMLTASGIDWGHFNGGIMCSRTYAGKEQCDGIEMWRLDDGNWYVEQYKRYSVSEAVEYIVRRET